MPKRIKYDKDLNRVLLKKLKDWFFVFWLGQLLLNQIAKSFLAGEEALSMVGLIFIFLSIAITILAVLCLFKITFRLYNNPALFIAGYFLAMIAPFGGLLSFIIMLTIINDTDKVLKSKNI